MALAISAGVLIYAGAVHLLPSIEKENRRFTVLTLGAGVVTAFVMILLKG